MFLKVNILNYIIGNLVLLVGKKNVHSYYVSHKILNLMPNFYICGENYSNYQAWCEGALSSSLQVIEKLDCVLKHKNNKKNKKI